MSIIFTTSSGGVSSNVANLAPGRASSVQNPQQLNVTVNYTLTNLNNGQIRGPYGIEVGSGPIRINVSNGLPDLDTVSIPVGGQVQFNSDATYGISWVPENVLSPV